MAFKLKGGKNPIQNNHPSHFKQRSYADDAAKKNSKKLQQIQGVEEAGYTEGLAGNALNFLSHYGDGGPADVMGSLNSSGDREGDRAYDESIVNTNTASNFGGTNSLKEVFTGQGETGWETTKDSIKAEKKQIQDGIDRRESMGDRTLLPSQINAYEQSVTDQEIANTLNMGNRKKADPDSSFYEEGYVHKDLPVPELDMGITPSTNGGYVDESLTNNTVRLREAQRQADAASSAEKQDTFNSLVKSADNSFGLAGRNRERVAETEQRAVDQEVDRQSKYGKGELKRYLKAYPERRQTSEAEKLAEAGDSPVQKTSGFKMSRKGNYGKEY